MRFMLAYRGTRKTLYVNKNILSRKICAEVFILSIGYLVPRGSVTRSMASMSEFTFYGGHELQVLYL